jgi:hypothetical protein
MPERGSGGAQKGGWPEAWATQAPITIKRIEAAARPEYVAWIDLMGAKNWMAGSIRRAAEIISLIHIAGLRATRNYSVRSYPVIDGVYLIGENKSAFRDATGFVMRLLAKTFLSRKPTERFLVRGGIGYGRVLHGNQIAALHADLKNERAYSACLAIGISIGQAYSAESKAPPFGFYVDMTARSTASGNDSPYTSAFYRWWSASRQDERSIATEFGEALCTHFDYLKQKGRELEYPSERMADHLALAREYFRVTGGPGGHSPDEAE